MRKSRRAAGGEVVQTCTEMDSRSASDHRKLPAVQEDGPHLGGDAIRGIKEQLEADRQKVRQSQSLLAAIGRNPAHGHGEGLGTIAGAR